MSAGTASGKYFTVPRTYSGATAFSVAAWINWSATGSGTVAGLWEDSGTVHQWVVIKDTNAKTTMATQNPNYYIVTSANDALTADTWTHLCLLFSTSATCKSYINGTEVGTAANTNSSGLSTRSASFGLGARQAGNSPFAGSIAEFATWTRRLTTDEVSSLAKGFKPSRVPRPDVYIPAIRSVKDFTGNYAITTVGSPTVESHPRVY